ncbi:MAG TPA: acylphosphatase [Bacillaceae bacterium]|nr:acylphosphatase [Paenibacillus bovis]HLU22787.1 acylphosphatase [Bacillaceae bacterium]
MMSLINKWREDYVIWHANRIKIPSFEAGNIIRRNITFSGRVQNVGFRLEVNCLAQRLQLIGWVKNLADGSVEAELQGNESKINFLVNCMKSLKRASVQNITSIDLPLQDCEDSFVIRK